MSNNRLTQEFYLNDDVVQLSRALLGKFIVTEINGQRTIGMIVETEAYNGIDDSASHAFNNRRTERTQTMYGAGGFAYIYLCYGLHHLFNVVTAPKDNPQAVLIRAIEPIEGIATMLERRHMQRLAPRITNGPGCVSQALGITTKLNGSCLVNGPIWIEDRGAHIGEECVLASPRVGIEYAKAHKHLPWRFRINNNRYRGK